MLTVTRNRPWLRLALPAILVIAGWHAQGATETTTRDAQAVKTDAERAAHMQEHFGRVMTVHAAVIRGDLAAVRPAATWLAEHGAPASLPAGSSTHVAAMQQSARRAAEAETILAAAIATASMLKTCGDCHRAVGTRPGLALPVRPELGGLVGHMLAHQTAADEMVQGLVAPSSELWRKGAEGFRGAPLHPDKLPAGTTPGSQILASEERIHQLASQAVRAEDPGARAMFYGQIIARCADCHTLHRKIWGPSDR